MKNKKIGKENRAILEQAKICLDKVLGKGLIMGSPRRKTKPPVLADELLEDIKRLLKYATRHKHDNDYLLISVKTSSTLVYRINKAIDELL